MKYLLDTNIISECYKAKAHPSVRIWLQQQNPSDIYLNAITIGEMRYGIEKKRTEYPAAADRFANILRQIEMDFFGRILAFDHQAAHMWGQIMVHYPNNPTDTQIAGIALSNGAAIVTRDKDFTDLTSRIAHLGLALPLINPFETH